MLRGEFIRADGLVIPNNITTFGIETILGLALRSEDASFYVGLCSAVYVPDLTALDITEPTIGVNGYDRIEIPRDDTGWPGNGAVNDQPYLESDFLTWEASGGNFDKSVSRMFIILDAASTSDPVFALSAALPDEFVITPATPESERKFKYRIYGR